MTASRARTAAAAGALTFAYYATPDVLPSRLGRGLVKGALVATIGAITVAQERADKAAAAESDDERASADDTTEGDDEASWKDALTELPSSRRWAMGGAAAGVAVLAVGASIAATVALEKWIFRRGEARAAAGAPLPHTAPAVLFGALAGVLSLVPPPRDGEPRP